MITPKQSKIKAKKDKETAAKREARLNAYKAKKAKQSFQEDISDRTKDLQVNPIAPEVAAQLEAFMTHENYFNYFLDVAVAVSKKDVDMFPDIKSMIPYIFTVKHKEIAFIAEELGLLFHLFSTCIRTLKDPESKDNMKVMAEDILNETDVTKLNAHINELRVAFQEHQKQQQVVDDEVSDSIDEFEEIKDDE